MFGMAQLFLVSQFDFQPPHQTGSPVPRPIFAICAGETRFDIYGTEKRFERALKNLKNDGLILSDAERILERELTKP